MQAPQPATASAGAAGAAAALADERARLPHCGTELVSALLLPGGGPLRLAISLGETPPLGEGAAAP